MNSFFCEDTEEEEKLLNNILKNTEDKLPETIEKIITSHLIKNDKENKKEELNIKSESSENIYTKKGNDENSIIDKYTNEEKINFNLETNIFSFHIKKNGKINADIFFIPYKSEDGKDIITKYAYNYDYYDIYSLNVENINKCIHSNKRKLEDNENCLNINKKIKIKKEIENESSYSKFSEQRRENFQKLLVHFRGRLFIGNSVIYSFFKTKTYLSMLHNNETNENKIEEFHFVDKKIQTYNLIKKATYWKQDEYPDISDTNIQKLLFFLIIPPLYNYKYEEELSSNIIF
ncbi:conserved Plasmodium protein, unknown function [Plasmodium gallinaceum]|uniref:Uncharacterized protein n=1 Tax=Plasmodium gallinaceum TaxID=5849 RepID=A0A1J1GWK3_PLAGA|nr:conserved Plasmodium protein, unknown function [Plasmodium gallinaceum]CRG96701.1 conserved Plasmodium protein, unknown function [Plasmodium gallinaceum]